tara:strand:- start:63123 stop:63977 length:855 start_codon:yes stop_codon:yes gene_type:complete
MTLRRPPFAYTRNRIMHWNAAKPEFSQIVNAASLSMPYLEPYLIATMRKARPLVTDPQLARDIDLYCGQESAHYRQHMLYNEEIRAASTAPVRDIEKLLADDYASMGKHRSLRFNLAYAEGFESMALAIGQTLIEDRVYYFGHADSAVASLVLWHFAEEIEHKNVTFDVFENISGSHFWRAIGLVYATLHIFRRTRTGYQALLKADGLWSNWRSRLALARILLRIFRKLTPRLLRVLLPGYRPAKIADPAWLQHWAALHIADKAAPARIDTDRLDESRPVSLPA